MPAPFFVRVRSRLTGSWITEPQECPDVERAADAMLKLSYDYDPDCFDVLCWQAGKVDTFAVERV